MMTMLADLNVTWLEGVATAQKEVARIRATTHLGGETNEGHTKEAARARH
jgi:hypothetical protein